MADGLRGVAPWARGVCREGRPGRGFAPPRTPPHQRLKAFGNLGLGARKSGWRAWVRGHAGHRPMWARAYPPTPEIRGPGAGWPLAGWLGGAAAHRREECAARADQGVALPLPGPRPTKGLRPLETSDLAPTLDGGALGRSAIRGTNPGGHTSTAQRQVTAVQGPAGPWRGGLERRRPSNLHPHGAAPLTAAPSVALIAIPTRPERCRSRIVPPPIRARTA
jgi:hypothetical protein